MDWIPVSERLPEYDKKVLIWSQLTGIACAKLQNIKRSISKDAPYDNRWFIAHGQAELDDVECWQELPTAPGWSDESEYKNIVPKNKTCLTCDHFSNVTKVEVRKQIEISGYEAVMDTVNGFAFSGNCARLLDFCEYEQCGCGYSPTINGNFGCHLRKPEQAE
jgi:hypothetical protein